MEESVRETTLYARDFGLTFLISLTRFFIVPCIYLHTIPGHFLKTVFACMKLCRLNMLCPMS
ncbi:hypothetical protein SLEP1_g3575 [Rubroshorea leprosula]|uniref:Uncharacterized protein n=1 Tax=Rubroshorea leprosula TaxID=152421 RepID=A0AAV5HWC1_9ROSI|nr:hypothetical protein SLEP1_g3575 [Rubroshorea leprosula]